ncbi:hypothetical protein [Rhizobium mesosinicum]|uniref:CD-NTase-associated protein 15 domain-containing protein n=1 Tax=Rhizobium mesosinicum TaxID=335017 RepID=A0ABS7GQN8_9HYPH|nr:hypothetical protein [Rhizobium mesosinicum]MBW9052265.1 hypothetical protein [Rhizobium mesosinicum]
MSFHSRDAVVLDHEYSVVGHNRANVGRCLAILSAALASAFVTLGALWGQLATYLGVPQWTNFLVIPVSAASIYGITHWLFNKWGWMIFFRVVGLPNIAGEWTCDGQTFDDNGNVSFQWKAQVSITQSWEKIRVYLRSAQSSSSSASAALVSEGGGRWMLMYSYRNTPRAGEVINPHLGYCELSFQHGFNQADGDYFTARGRGTSGRMTLTRVQ